MNATQMFDYLNAYRKEILSRDQTEFVLGQVAGLDEAMDFIRSAVRGEETQTMVLPRDLKLADVVQLGLSEGYETCTVSQIVDDMVHLVRPYIHCADFSYTGGVITYIGQETVKLWTGDTRPVQVLRRTELK